MGDEFKERVRERYADAARAVRGGGAEPSCCEPSCCGPERGTPLRDADEVVGGASCCGPTCCGSDGETAAGTDMTGGAYSEVEKGELPRLAAEASLGCGNPVALADLEALRQVPIASAFVRARKPEE